MGGDHQRPAGRGVINAVREDTYRRGLLFAASELGVYVSFDDGENWQSLRLNMPATSVRDLVVKDADLVVGTHGRGFWILDDITPLRQITPDIAKAQAFLFWPAQAYRARWNVNTDTPLPPDEPAAAESAGRRHVLVSHRTRRHRADQPRHRRSLDGRGDSPLLERRPAGLARAGAQHPRLLAAPRRDALDCAGPASVRVGHAVRAAAG